MKLYHGSKTTITKPTHAGSKIDNDYGAAFYMTADLESAHEWACRNNSVGIVNEYELNEAGLKILDLSNKKKYSVLNWLAILLHFRTLDDSFKSAFKSRLEFLDKNYFIDVTKYYFVIGYRADDAYFRFPLDFVRGNLTMEQLESSFMLGELGIQYVLVGKKGFESLSFIRAFSSEDKYINRYFDNVSRATEAFDRLDKDEEGTRIIDVMRNKK